MLRSLASRLQFGLVLALLVPMLAAAAPAAAEPDDRRPPRERDVGEERRSGGRDARTPSAPADDRSSTVEAGADDRVAAADKKKNKKSKKTNKPNRRNKPARPNPPGAAPAAPAPAPAAAPAPAPAPPSAPLRASAPAPVPAPNPGAGSGDLICQDDPDDADAPGGGDEPLLDTCRADQVIVQLISGRRIDDVNGRQGTTTLASIPSRALYLLQLPKAAAGGITDEAEYRKKIEDDEDTEQAYFNYTNQAPEGRPRRLYAQGAPGIQGATSASDAAAPPSQLGVAAAGSCGTGQGVVVAVIDTGIERSHRAFAGTTFVAPTSVLPGSTEPGDVGDGLDNDRDGLIDEMTGHGTHVAGIVAQVAPGASLMPIKALDSDGIGDAFFLAKAIYHAIDKGADVINLSLGTTADPNDILVVQAAIKEATETEKLTVVAAAGNENRLQPQEYPATGSKAIGVASTTDADDKSDFSNFHDDLDLGAPGTDIVSAFPNNGYRSWSGTSMATPWVAGAAALLLENDPSLDIDKVESRLRQTAAPFRTVANATYDGKLGGGRLDVAAAVGCR